MPRRVRVDDKKKERQAVEPLTLNLSKDVQVYDQNI